MKGFFKDHMDTLAIIGTVITMLAWNVNQNAVINSRIDQTNCRLDQLYTTMIELIKERKHDSHS